MEIVIHHRHLLVPNSGPVGAPFDFGGVNVGTFTLIRYPAAANALFTVNPRMTKKINLQFA